MPQDPADEPAPALLERIHADRRARWEADARTRGKDPARTRYPAPAAPDTDTLPDLPPGWAWASVDQLGAVQLGRQRSPDNRSKDFPTKYIRAANITEMGLDLTDVLDMEFSPRERETYQLWQGDIVLSEASGSPDQVGKPAVWRGEIEECCFQNTVIRVRPYVIGHAYLLVLFQNYYVNKVFSYIAAGVGINHLSAGKFARISVPLPPLAEQARIVAEVERRLSVVTAAEASIAASLRRAARLRQAILARAFAGRLVPQDPSDEPAAALLARIRAARVGAVPRPPRRASRHGTSPIP